jgi:hypothetical protein
MTKNSTVYLTIFLLFLLIIPLFISPLVAEDDNTTPTVTLADTINTILNGIKEHDSSWSVIYDQVFGLQNTTVYDNAITVALNAALNDHNYKEVIFIARLAELNNYTSLTINNSLRIALENMPKAGNLPVTYTYGERPDSFIVHDRFMINMYRYAQNLNITRWNINAAYDDFVKAYETLPRGSRSGEMLWINLQIGLAESYSSRYYDEHAETLDMFLLFALNGVDNAMSYAEHTWNNTQAHWNGTIYVYTDGSNIVECEMGNFAQIITEYQNYNNDNITYYERVITDLENKLLANQYDSPGWGGVGVIRHASTNQQKRLYETLANLIALQMLYPQFTEGNQTNFQNMLTNGWQGLINSNLFNNNKFRFVDTDGYTDGATIFGAMTLFLYGITPQTGSLAINASEERYHDSRTCFPTSQWQFNYTNHSIRIPINKGTLTFNFGTQNVTQNFPENGVYDIQFSNDWNTIETTSKITNEPTEPTPTQPPPSSSSEPKPSSTPKPTTPPPPQTNKQTPTITLQCKTTYTNNNQQYQIKITGTYTNNNTPLTNQPIQLYTSKNNGQTWQPLTTINTNNEGKFTTTYNTTTTETFLIKAQNQPTQEYNQTTTTINITIQPITTTNNNNNATTEEEEGVFTVSSNSTISELIFNSKTNELSFTTTGTTNTIGYTNINIPKTLLQDTTNLKIYIDKKETAYNITQEKDSWTITLTYTHSTHTITINLNNTQNQQSTTITTTIIIATTLTICVISIIIKKKQHNKN